MVTRTKRLIVTLYVHGLYCYVIRTWPVLLRYTYMACIVTLYVHGLYCYVIRTWPVLLRCTYMACIVTLYVHGLYCYVIRTWPVLLRYTYMACIVSTRENGIYSNCRAVEQCFSTAGPRLGTGPWHQLYRAARGSPGSCNFSFLSIFHE